jgi:hypothetical protein
MPKANHGIIPGYVWLTNVSKRDPLSTGCTTDSRDEPQSSYALEVSLAGRHGIPIEDILVIGSKVDLGSYEIHRRKAAE